MKAEEFGKYLRKLRNEKKMTVRQLDLYSGVSHSYLSQIENGKRGVPSPEILKKLHKPLGVSFEDLMRAAGHIDVELPQTIMESATPYEPSRMLRVPVLGTIRAGQPIDRLESIEGYELVEPELLRGRSGFVLRVQGDSMIGDRIYEGDRVVVVTQQVVNSTDIAVVAVNGCEATLKRVKYQDGMAILSSSNPAMETMVYPAKDVFVLGKVIEVRHSLE
ncbi:helix-turn-helix domain-containing protein [Cohnella massiliensis]|uniref:helix-turn-helix domain-containing protein n=1 Tax=Cohnella massiliensis TaxID=1816691 RepID=UPI0009BAF0A5|nr:XRE family transcriptional regulator [Cohnella massiliensis]